MLGLVRGHILSASPAHCASVHRSMDSVRMHAKVVLASQSAECEGHCQASPRVAMPPYKAGNTPGEVGQGWLARQQRSRPCWPGQRQVRRHGCRGYLSWAGHRAWPYSGCRSGIRLQQKLFVWLTKTRKTQIGTVGVTCLQTFCLAPEFSLSWMS